MDIKTFQELYLKIKDSIKGNYWKCSELSTKEILLIFETLEKFIK